MTGLAEFLAARLAEDVAAAVDAGGGRWEVCESSVYHAGAPGAGPVASWVFGYAPHIARHDPARALAEVAAKRAILAEHRHVPASYESDRTAYDFGCTICDRNDDGTIAPIGWCQTTRHLGAPYASHADYDPAWAPEGATP